MISRICCRKKKQMQILCTSTKFKSCKKHNKKKPNIINERLKKTSSMEENFLKVKTDYELIMENAVEIITLL